MYLNMREFNMHCYCNANRTYDHYITIYTYIRIMAQLKTNKKHGKNDHSLLHCYSTVSRNVNRFPLHNKCIYIGLIQPIKSGYFVSTFSTVLKVGNTSRPPTVLKVDEPTTIGHLRSIYEKNDRPLSKNQTSLHFNINLNFVYC